MNTPTHYHYFKIAVSVLALTLFLHDPALSKESMEIFAWVAGQMKIADAGLMPVVNLVDKPELQAAFTSSNHNAYMRWKAEYGAHQAQKIMNGYLQELLGMFDPHTETIYVDRFLTPCRREAILAHEFTHYFQQRQHGRVGPDEPGAEYLHLKREMEASDMEKRYGEYFCNNP